MRDPNYALSRADSEQSGLATADTTFLDEPCDFVLPFEGDGIVPGLDPVACGIADCVPVRIAILDSRFTIRALNTEWRCQGPHGFGTLGQGFVETCLSTASVPDRSFVAESLAKLNEMASQGFMATIGLELNGELRNFNLRARRLPQSPARIAVALLDVTERRSVAQIVLDAEETERRRIARELHDETAQQLAAMQLGLACLRECGTGAKFDSTCCEIEVMLRSVQNELRTLSYTLHPPEIDDVGLVKALSRFVSGFARRTRLNTVFVDETGGLPTDGLTDRALYRVTQEALINVGKHAKATKAIVSLCEAGQRLVLEVEDDGIGILPELCSSRSDARLGVGLSAMRERIEALAGRLEISRLSTGTRIRAILPARGAGGRLLRVL